MQIKLNDACKLMERVNSSKDFNCYFEGQGDGNVKCIIESKIVTIKEDYNGKN